MLGIVNKAHLVIALWVEQEPVRYCHDHGNGKVGGEKDTADLPEL